MKYTNIQIEITCTSAQYASCRMRCCPLTTSMKLVSKKDDF